MNNKYECQFYQGNFFHINYTRKGCVQSECNAPFPCEYQSRLDEMKKCIIKRTNSSQKLLPEWIEEYNELIEE